MTSVAPLLISSVTATTLSYILTGTDPMFPLRNIEVFAVARIPWYLILGAVCGLVSLYFTRGMNTLEQWMKHNVRSTGLKILVGGLTLSLLIFFIACQLFTHHQLQPLTLLTESARRIADGHYDETVPDTNREDEIGQLQGHFQKMQQALAAHIGQQEQLSEQLQQRGEELQAAYSQAQEADRMKTAFLHYMTNQLIAPSDAIDKSVTTLCNHFDDINSAEAGRQVDIISHSSEEILRVLDHMLQTAVSDKGKEGADV